MSTSHSAVPALVIFDCDGVLVDSERIANELLAAHLQRAGIGISAAATRAQFQGHSAGQCQAMIAQWLGADGARRLWRDMQAQTLVALAAVQPIAGVRDVLQRLWDESQAFCVASAGDHDKMAVTLGATGLQRAFNLRCFSAVDVARSKPAPDVFLLAAETLQCVPHRCLVVEDSQQGVQAALAAGMAVCWYQPDEMTPVAAPWRAAGVQVFTAMAQLPGLISQWRESLP